VRYWFSLGRIRWFHATLRVHVSVVVAVGILAFAAVESPAYAAVVLFSLLGLILLHELGHALVARHFGYSTTAIWFSLLHGRCEYESPDSAWERSLVAWGGVLAQAVIAIPICVIDALWHGPVWVLGPAVLILGYWSLVLIMLNLLPLHGFDGKQAWRIVPLIRKQLAARRAMRTAVRRARGD
jgi:stage IV sporulation protein FB